MAEIADLAARLQPHERPRRELRRAARGSAAPPNRELFIGSIRAFAAAIDAKDPYTRGHSERVAELSRTIARHLGQTEEFQQRVWIGALLHDVGKIGVEDRILQQGRRADAGGVRADEDPPGDRRRDPARRSSSCKEMMPGRALASRELERQGLSGRPATARQIPLMARIVAVADAFDAITTNRPYQEAYDPRVRGRDHHQARRQPLRRQGGHRVPARLRGRRSAQKLVGQTTRPRRSRSSCRRAATSEIGPGSRACPSSTSSRTCWPRTTDAVGVLFLDDTRRDRSTSPAPTSARTRCASSAPTSASTCARPSGSCSETGHGRRRSWLHVEKDALHIYAMPLPDGYYLVLVQRRPALVAARRARTLDEACVELELDARAELRSPSSG